MPTTLAGVRLATSGIAAMLAVAVAAPAAAQDATPEAGMMAFPIVPDPAACQVEPRATDELLALWYTPDGEPVPAATPAGGAEATSLTLPVGPPADEATIASVVATVSEVFGCFVAGDFPRATALFSDDLTRGFGGEPGTTVEEARGFLEATPMPESEGDVGQIVAVTDVMDLSDGRVGAFIVDGSEGQLDTVYVIFVREGDRLLADELFDFVAVDD